MKGTLVFPVKQYQTKMETNKKPQTLSHTPKCNCVIRLEVGHAVAFVGYEQRCPFGWPALQTLGCRWDKAAWGLL